MKTETTAITLLAEATMKAAVHIAIAQGISKQNGFSGRLTEALRSTVKGNLERVMEEWKEATEANLSNAWLQELMKTQSVELAQMAVKSIS